MSSSRIQAPAGFPGPVLLYDDTCGFCGWWVQWVLTHERDRQDLRFAGLDGPLGASVRLRHPCMATADSIVWLAGAAPDQVPLVRSDAVLAILRYVGGIWRTVAEFGAVVPRPWRNAVYGLVARHRHHLTGSARCVLPPPGQRHRFLDLMGSP